MTRGYARVAHAMEILASSRPSLGEGAAVPIGSDRNINEARLAKDHDGDIHLLVMLPPGRMKFDLPLGNVLPATWLDDQEALPAQSSLDIRSTDASLTPTFLSLVGEMLSRVDESGAACIDELMRVLTSWREALARERRGLSRERAIGLFGELVVLASLAKADPARARAAWRGKDGFRHDFFLHNALEVKAYLGAESPSVEIHGAHQLDPPLNASLHLLALRLEENDDGRSIDDLIDEIDSYGLPKGLLFDRSTEGAPVISDGTMKFVVANQRLFRVTERFPGIRFSALGEAAFEGISHLRYSLLLDACPDAVDLSELAKVLEEL
ncbi:PD-(D/E)XK motif protein [Microbacterium trichothecenolyticum]|uniref:PD-(D/E)XK motif protein n=1 Tax=Microbacterium trichothecenolyticum TaxID=69370 RepID=UPI001C6E7E83|nr:PD-(D/E)XK motif protein [Microbacterium trichothecenolyticum]MBW9120771.1 PD-(D/E)XK motif protein [Microbacterium trichothecenolyticum]